MRFSFKCQAIRHVSGRVTVTPLDFPELAVHAATVARAVEELTLALDDRMARAHPRRLVDLARASEGEAIELSVPALRVWGASSDEQRLLRVNAVLAPAHKPFVEIRSPRLDVRFWLDGKTGELGPEAEELLRARLERDSDDQLLDLRPEGQESLMDLVVEATPLRLSDLKRSELRLDERAPERPKLLEDLALDALDDDERADPDDDWDDVPRKHRRSARARAHAAGRKRLRRAPTPTLARIGVAWHELAAEGALEPAFERDPLVDALAARLRLDDPEPLVLIGGAGVGKTAILHELARRLAAEEAARPEAERDPRPFFYVDASRLIAGEGGFGDWQQQVLDVLSEARRAHAVLCLGHLGDLLDAGKSAHSEQNVAQLIAPALAARDITVLAEATPEEWATLEQRQQGFARAFALLRVEAPTPEASARILARVGEALGRDAYAERTAASSERSLVVEPAAIAEIQALCLRFSPYGALVGNAVAMLRRLVDRRAHALARRVTAADALALFSAESGVPERLLRDDLPLDDAEVRAFLAARVKGQDDAVARAASVVAVIKANLADRQRPTAVLLFAGPTGVGKTELCKALAELVFGARDRLVRLDMGEYAGPDALARLVGEGRTPGHLAGAVRRQPFCVVLLDEIEKAHPAVFDALLGVLGEGRLTDAGGRFTDFRSAVIVMTSNLGADTWRARAGFGGASAAADGAALVAHYRGEAARFFRPELYNRLDDVVVFRPLGAAEIRSIVERELERVAARDGFRRRDVRLTVDDAARAHLAARGLDPRYGARPLKRTLERELVGPVAEYLADHPPGGGATRLDASVGPTGVVLAATSLGGHEEGVSRAAIERVLTRASELRAEVRRWARSRPMLRLRQELQLYERLSRQPSFWHDRALADERARAAADGRELMAAFAAAERQAETAEDLAYEAYYGRQVAAARTLDEELDAVHAQLVPLGERLFSSLFPPRGTVALVLTTGRSGWRHLCVLADAIAVWAKRRGGTVLGHLLEPKPAKAPPAPAPGQRARKPRGKGEPEAEWRWVKGMPVDQSSPPAAAVLYVSGARALMLLAAEHGAHRFTSGGATSIVKVRFEPGAPAISSFPGPAELEPAQPGDEIRRLWPDKEQMVDERTGWKGVMATPGRIDLEPVLAAYLRWRIFSPDAADDDGGA